MNATTSLVNAAAADEIGFEYEEIPRATKAMAVVAEPAATPMAMIASAVSRGASIETIERLIALQERMESNEARKAFVAAMAEFKAESLTIVKNKQVGFASKGSDIRTAYSHATLDTIVAAVGPKLAEVGLSYRWKTEQLEGGLIQVSCIVRHILGHTEETALRASPDQSGSKNNVQAVGSTVTYLSRYTLMSALGLASADQDDDGSGGEDSTITLEQVSELQDVLAAGNANIGAFCKYLNISALVDITAANFPSAMAAAKKKLNRGASHAA